MKLFTTNLRKEVLTKSKGKDYYSSSNSSIVLVEFFELYGRGTWLITHAQEMRNGDLLLYGLMNINFSEWGFVTLSELESLGWKIERNKFLPKDITVGERKKELNI